MPSRQTSVAGAPPGGVQSLVRAFDLLELLADQGGRTTLTVLAAASGIPLSTIHRLMNTLVAQGYVTHEPSGDYALGSRLVRLADVGSRLLGAWARPYLAELVEITGETSNIAVLEGDRVVYIAQVAGHHSMRMFIEPGRRVGAHCTAVGKAILAQLPDRHVQEVLDRNSLERFTPATITEPTILLAHLGVIRRKGYALDEGEHEVGVRCVAAAVPSAPTATALSVSAPVTRMTDAMTETVADALIRVAAELSERLKTADERAAGG